MNHRVALLLLGLVLVAGLRYYQLTQAPSREEAVPAEARRYLGPLTYRGVPIRAELPVDAIPPITAPRYEDVETAGAWMNEEDDVIGVSLNGEARAYPVRILNWHEIVNETIGGRPVVVTYCPLCRSGIVFDRRFEEATLTFGNTGALFESGMVLYDRELGNLWHQPGGEAIAGPQMGKRLQMLPSHLTTWRQWKSAHPNTLVLSPDTGFARDYRSREDKTFDQTFDQETLLPGRPVSHSDFRLPPRKKILGVVVDGVAKAYPLDAIREMDFEDTLNGARLRIIGASRTRPAAAMIQEEENVLKPASFATMYWFAWRASYPDTLIWKKPSLP